MVYVQNYEKWQITFLNRKKLNIVNSQNENESYQIELNDKNSNEINELIKSFLQFDFSIDNEKNFNIKSETFPMKENDVSISVLKSKINKNSLEREIDKKSKIKKFKNINSMAFFPILNIILLSYFNQNELKAYFYLFELENQNYKYKDIIDKGESENTKITYICVKEDDDKYFLTASEYFTIKEWTIEKNNEKYDIKNKRTINVTAHNEAIIKILYWKDKIISLSKKEPIKFWKNENAILLKKYNTIYSILKLNDNEIVASGLGGTFFYDLNECKLKKKLDDVKCQNICSLIRINENEILTFYKNTIYIVSINSKEISLTQKIEIENYEGIIKKGIFLFLLNSKNQEIYAKVYTVIKNSNQKNTINPFNLPSNKSIASGNLTFLCDSRTNYFALYTLSGEVTMINIDF